MTVPLSGFSRPAMMIEQRRFSATARADQTNEFAFAHCRAHAIERLHETGRGRETFRDVVDRELARRDNFQLLTDG